LTPGTRGDAAAAVVLAIAIGLVAPATGLAQHTDVGLKTDVGLSVGFYTPLGSMVERGVKNDPQNPYFQQRLQSTLSLGANVVVWTSSRVGVAGSINFSPSNVAQSDTSGTHDYASPRVLANARVLFAFTPMPFKPPPGHRETPWSFYVGAGVGLANRSGAIWAYSSGFTSPALVFDVGVRTAVGGRVVMRFDAEDYLSRAQFDKGLPTETAARTHNDLMISFSLSYRVVR
jgi:hypothetical protein